MIDLTSLGAVAMRSLIAILTLCSIGPATGQEPPKPRVDEPVDYVAWVNQTFGGSIKDNAADKYREAFGAYVAPNDKVREQTEKRFGSLYGGDDDGPATSAQWIRANKKSLRLFEEATRIRDCYFDRTSKSKLLVDALCPDLAYFRQTRILLRVRAHHRLRQGALIGATDDVRLILQSTRHLYAGPALIEHISAGANALPAYAEVREWLAETPASVDCQVVIERLRLTDRPPPLPKVQMRFERATIWDVLQRDGGSEPGQACNTQRELDSAVEELERIYGVLDRLYTAEYATAERLWADLENEFEHMRDPVAAKREGLACRIAAKLAASITAGAVRSTARNHRKVIAERNAMYALLAIHDYKAKRGKWPKRLKEAMPGILAEFRRDPFSGMDLVYRLRNDRPLLYSVGLDGVDNGGSRGKKTWEEQGDAVFWPPDKKPAK